MIKLLDSNYVDINLRCSFSLGVLLRKILILCKSKIKSPFINKLANAQDSAKYFDSDVVVYSQHRVEIKFDNNLDFFSSVR